MQTLFPALLTFSFFAPLILRVSAGLALAVIARRLMARREAIAAIPFPLIGTPQKWMISLSALVTALAGLSVFLGLYTQAGALVGALVSLKHFFAPERFSSVRPLSKDAYALLFAICLSLLVLGAGGLAFDLPY